MKVHKSYAVSRVFVVRCNAVVIDDENNFHSSIEMAERYLDGLFKHPGNFYDIAKIETTHTIYHKEA
jgi:hypothetical protein